MQRPSRLNSNSYRICLGLLTLASISLVVLICWFLRNIVLGCHDSLAEFTYAKQWDLDIAYTHSRNFCLQRGRTGYLFPLVVTFRFFVHKYGNYTAVWLLQQVPIWFNVFFVSYIVARKTRPHYGIFFAAFFAAFIQIDIDHNLMTCYPLDFMYGLTLQILGLYLYDGWLAHLKDKKKTNWIRLGISCLCYYESMQVYEAFLMACFCYAVISLAYVVKDRKELGRKWFGRFILQLVPHAVTGMIFVGILFYIRTHPVVDGTLSSGDPGKLGFFLPTWLTFSVSLFPLRHRPEISRLDSLASIFTDPFTGLCVLAIAVAAAMLFMCILKSYPDRTKEEKISINFRLGVLGITGLAHAMSFNIPLGIDNKYQQWVNGVGTKGYITGVIGYFGWALFLVCAGCLIANFITRYKSYIRIPAYVIAVLGLACGTAFTASINELYINAEAATHNCISKRGQAFYAFVTSDDIAAMNADYIYVPDYSGVHGFLNIDNDYANYELGKPLTLENNIEAFEANSINYPIVSEFRYNGVLVAGYYVVLDNPWETEDKWVTTSDIIIVTARPEPVIITYYDETAGMTVTTELEGGRMKSFVIENSNTVSASSINISAGE